MSFTPASGTYTRTDGRRADEMREVRITPGFMPYAEGSALIEVGGTRVICTATLDERVPPFRRNTGQGWLTAEYAMLPRATQQRTQRETGRGGPSGRTHEIQRLIGRSLRAVANLSRIGERTITLDCDVLQADGGTRTASICGGYLALHDAMSRLAQAGLLRGVPLTAHCAAISVEICPRSAEIWPASVLRRPWISEICPRRMLSSPRSVEMRPSNEPHAFSAPGRE